MKTMTCKQLGGVCDQEFHGSTFDDIAEQSKKHGIEMFLPGDAAHLKAIKEMQEMMQSVDAMSKWMDNKRNEFDALPDND